HGGGVRLWKCYREKQHSPSIATAFFSLFPTPRTPVSTIAPQDMTIPKQFEPPVGHRRSTQKNGAYRLGKFELRLCPLPLAPQGGFFTPPMRWLDYAAPELASLRRP
ncbi:hypothetical protein, partial [Caballeronia sp. RCC_10]|uniref:hypothetical protein n=1 Tax=Caballeronia sp. RCC_10 TaxID=3239227 RepID=UPI00352600EB